ncbi:hypothetical protein [Clostridium cuniculi]|uniref:hypothetical protein n=1 Tax=Clostridium cuniculi TaxID=2548455 RepID=UPI001054AF7F|nr:hypothetical protein [Clostridium cuniculi]
MKTITKILLTISIILGALITTAALTINSIDKTESGLLINFNDGSGYYIERSNKEEIKPTFEVTNILYESTNDFYLEPNEIGIEFSNGSWAVINEQTNTYIFQAIELGDYDQQFNDLEELENCIKTYSSIQNTGSY